MRKIDDTENGGGGWTATNVKRDAGALLNNKALRLFVALVIIGMLINHFTGS